MGESPSPVWVGKRRNELDRCPALLALHERRMASFFFFFLPSPLPAVPLVG